MAHIRVGSQECKTEKLLPVILKCSGFSELRTDWETLAVHLELPVDMIDDISEENKIRKPIPIVYSIIVKWVAKYSTQATLGVLVKALDASHYTSIADAIRDAWKFEKEIDDASKGDSESVSEASSSKSTTDDENEGGVSIKAKQDFIMENMTDLIAVIEWNATLSSKMTAYKIFSRDDVEELDAIPVRGKRNKQFFMFIHDRLQGQPNLYRKLIEMLDSDKLRQTGASAILKKVYPK